MSYQDINHRGLVTSHSDIPEEMKLTKWLQTTDHTHTQLRLYTFSGQKHKYTHMACEDTHIYWSKTQRNICHYTYFFITNHFTHAHTHL